MSHDFFVKAVEGIESKYIPVMSKVVNQNCINFFKEVVKTGKTSIKFTVPDNGKLIDDSFKGLDGSILKLPYQNILLEFYSDTDEGLQKNILIASEVDNAIRVSLICDHTSKETKRVFGPWGVVPGYAMIVRNDDELTLRKTSMQDSSGALLSGISFSGIAINLHLAEMGNLALFKDTANAIFIHAIMALFEFLEALSCSNVYVENEKYSKNKKQKRPAGLQYTYKILKVNVVANKEKSIRGPINECLEERATARQHLRRGHIRKQPYKDCVKKIWINPTIINAGQGGVISKEYLLA